MGDKNTLSERKITSESPRDHSLTDGAGSELTAAVYRGERLLLEGLLCTVVQKQGMVRPVFTMQTLAARSVEQTRC